MKTFHLGEIKFQEIEYVFCDSSNLLEQAFAAGLPRNTLIKTSSPSMLLDKKLNTLAIDLNISNDTRHQLMNGAEELARKIFKIYEGIDTFNFARFVSARHAFNFVRYVLKGSFLEPQDFKSNHLILNIQTEKEKFLNPPWNLFLKSNPHSKTINLTETEQINLVPENQTPILNRLNLGGWETALFRLGLKHSQFKFFSKNKAHILIPNDCELLIETCAHLILKNYRIVKIESKSQSQKNVSSVNFKDILPKLEKTIVEFSNLFCIEPVSIALKDIFLQQQIEEINNFFIFKTAWNEEIDQLDISKQKNNKIAVLTNGTVSPKLIALASVANDRKIPSFSFQHGVTNEIADHGNLKSAFYENNICNHYFVFNEKIKQVCEGALYKYGIVHDIGISKRHLMAKKMGKYFPKNLRSKIIYVSTNLYYGNRNIVYGSLSDYEKALKEIRIVDLLAKINQPICYKNYPIEARKYTDPDPVLPYIKLNYPHIFVLDKQIDMRYMLASFDIFITSVATSTLSWIYLSNKPLIFLNDSKIAGLKKELYDLMEKAIFLFDLDDPELESKLTKFFAQPQHEIFNSWYSKEREYYRSLIKRDYFTSYDDGKAGKRAAIVVENILTKHNL